MKRIKVKLKLLCNLLFLAFLMAAALLPATMAQEKTPVPELRIDQVAADGGLDLSKLNWKFQTGDNLSWAAPELDDASWQPISDTTLAPELLPGDWHGRGWFRLHLKTDQSLADKTLAISGKLRGATEIYFDGRKIADFGKITDTEISEYNPNNLPIPFWIETAGEHVLAIRYASHTFADLSSPRARWLTHGAIYPGFSFSIGPADDVADIFGNYAFRSSMRIGFFFIGVLLALALLHFLLYIFYRVERGNLFYSLYAASLGLFLLFNNFLVFGHQPIFVAVIYRVITTALLAGAFTGLLAFLHVAFDRKVGKLFWLLTGLSAINWVIGNIYLNNLGKLQILSNLIIGLTFFFCIAILVMALREKRSGAWILMIGVQILMLGMTIALLTGLGLINLPADFSVLAELSIILGVPVAVSVFLARNFARTSRDLNVQLAQVKTLSLEKIEQERQAAALRAENERRAKELEEARALQLSMLPRKLPQLPNLEIAAYMKPATEVGGDYYDFHVGRDGTLTVAVGDATGHGLKAGTVVTATKGLFNNLAPAPDIPHTLQQISHSLKQMNLRGLFMAMTMLKIKDNHFSISAAGMPSTLIYRQATGEIEEINLRALPLGSISSVKYQNQEFMISANDVIVLMSDGFPEMFNEAGEMIGSEEAAKILLETANLSAQQVIDRFIDAGESWAANRPPDDDVTFVIIKVLANETRDNLN